jgi:class 3 adenylate cyclase
VGRLAPIDRAAVLILVPLWIVCFGFAVRNQIVVSTGANLALSLEAPDSYPTLTGDYSSFVHPEDPLAAAGLLAGDHLIRLGDTDLRGVGTFEFMARGMEAARGAPTAPVVFERNGERGETTLPLAASSISWPGLINALALCASALFLLFRGTLTPTVRAWFYYAMAGAFLRTPFMSSALEVYVSFGIMIVAATVYLPLLINFLARFPDDRVPGGWVHRAWPWLFTALGGFFAAMQFSSRMKVAEMGFMVTIFTGVPAALAVATWKYRHADRIARRQMKWALYAIYCSALMVAGATALTAIDSRFGSLWFASYGVVTIFPISIVISVIRFNLFDIDRLISATASYNVLAMVLGSGALIVVPRIADAASGLIGIDSGASQVVLSVGLAALVIPAHRRLRPLIDRAFFKERYALDQGIAELLPTLAACSDARELTERTGGGLNDLLRPEACVIYAGAADGFGPVFVEGQAVPSAFAADSPLVGTLRGRRAPLALSASGRRPDESQLGPFDRAALETLQAEVVLPVHQEGALAAFLCLGPKRSGDVYTSTDLSLLAAVCETVSQQLQRFDQEEVTREAQEMRESLRRYVPGAVAEQLESGSTLAAAEKEVSVLFVDIRGYTGLSEGREAEEIFSTVNRYTETVSQIVQKHSGSVVEFNGDGMMAVFGAPRELAHKERAAVEAGRELVEAVGALRFEGAESDSAKLSVGIGIATGEVFVGNVQAVDRLIWSAIGNTTNLAARLQNLTRELGASIVVDAATCERAESAVADFECRSDVQIRGRREAQDVYALPMRDPGPQESDAQKSDAQTSGG